MKAAGDLRKSAKLKLSVFIFIIVIAEKYITVSKKIITSWSMHKRTHSFQSGIFRKRYLSKKY